MKIVSSRLLKQSYQSEQDIKEASDPGQDPFDSACMNHNRNSKECN